MLLTPPPHYERAVGIRNIRRNGPLRPPLRTRSNVRPPRESAGKKKLAALRSSSSEATVASVTAGLAGPEDDMAARLWMQERAARGRGPTAALNCKTCRVKACMSVPLNPDPRARLNRIERLNSPDNDFRRSGNHSTERGAVQVKAEDEGVCSNFVRRGPESPTAFNLSALTERDERNHEEGRQSSLT